MGMGGQRHAATALPQEKTRYPLYRRLGGPLGRGFFMSVVIIIFFFRFSCNVALLTKKGTLSRGQNGFFCLLAINLGIPSS